MIICGGGGGGGGRRRRRRRRWNYSPLQCYLISKWSTTTVASDQSWKFEYSFRLINFFHVLSQQHLKQLLGCSACPRSFAVQE